MSLGWKTPLCEASESLWKPTLFSCNKAPRTSAVCAELRRASLINGIQCKRLLYCLVSMLCMYVKGIRLYLVKLTEQSPRMHHPPRRQRQRDLDDLFRAVHLLQMRWYSQVRTCSLSEEQCTWCARSLSTDFEHLGVRYSGDGE